LGAAAEAQVGLPIVHSGKLMCFVAAWMLLGPWTAEAALLFVALAMGMQNAIRTSVAGASIGRSFVTGALFDVGNALARACLGRAPMAEAAADAASWLAFIVGVTCGTLAIGTLGLANALLAAASVVAALMALPVTGRR
jgi:oxalate decarboxylase